MVGLDRNRIASSLAGLKVTPHVVNTLRDDFDISAVEIQDIASARGQDTVEPDIVRGEAELTALATLILGSPVRNDARSLPSGELDRAQRLYAFFSQQMAQQRRSVNEAISFAPAPAQTGIGRARRIYGQAGPEPGPVIPGPWSPSLVQASGDAPSTVTRFPPEDLEVLGPNPPPLTIQEQQLDLRTIEAQLEQLEPLMKDRPGGADALAAARAEVARVRANLRSLPPAELSQRIHRTRVILDHTRSALTNLRTLQAGLTGANPEGAASEDDPHRLRYTKALDRVASLFDQVVARSLQGDVLDRFQVADAQAARLPYALLEADVDAFENLSAASKLLQPSIRGINDWARRVRPRLAKLERLGQQVAEARAHNAPHLAQLEKQYDDLRRDVMLSLEAMTYWEQSLRGYGNIVKMAPFEINGMAAFARLQPRMRAMRAAEHAGNIDELERLVNDYKNDEAVQNLLRNQHVFVDFSRVAASLSIVAAASMMSAGVGAAAYAAIGTTTTTTGAVASFVGVTALEALTFTMTSRGLQESLLGQSPQGSFLNDFAWNLGLFGLLKVGNLGAARMTQPVGIPAFTRLAQHSTSFPLLMGYGSLRHRVESGQWPSQQEFGRMSAETLVLMAAFAVGTRAFESRAPSQRPAALEQFRQRYGLRFEALEAGRQSLQAQVARAAELDPTAQQAVRADVARRARVMEAELQSLVEDIRNDPNVQLPALRADMQRFAFRGEAFRLHVRLMEAGLTGPEVRAIEAGIDARPVAQQRELRNALFAGTDYALRVQPDLATRREAVLMMGRAAAHPRIEGFADWVRFSTGQRPGRSPEQQTRNFMDDVSELYAAESHLARASDQHRAIVGGDARAGLRPGTTDPLPSFDLQIVGPNGQVQNIEVFSPRNHVEYQDFAEAIRHAADKVINDPSLPASLQTRGEVEGVVRIRWPRPPKSVKGGQLSFGQNGDLTITGRKPTKGRKTGGTSEAGETFTRRQGNLFNDYIKRLNSPKLRPDNAHLVNRLYVIDQAGNLVFTFTRDPSTNQWRGIQP